MYYKQIDKKSWLCVGEGPRNPVTGQRKQISRRGKSKKEAEAKVLEAIKKSEKNFSFDEKITFDEFSNVWLENYLFRGNKESTIDHRKYCINTINNYMAKVQINKINTLFYQKFLNQLMTEGSSLSTIKGINNVAQMIFKYAKEVGLIDNNPTESSFTPKPKLEIKDIQEDRIEKLFLNSDELKTFIEEVERYKSPVIRTLLYILTFTGMRPGEAISLYKDDIDFDKATIRINKTTYRMNRIKGEFKLTPPKTLGSIRIIEVDQFILEMIKEMQHFQHKYKYVESEFLFGMNDGFPTTIDYLRTVVRRIGEKTIISKQLHTYMLRHTHVSLLAEAGVDLTYIMNRVGHRNSKTTTEIYLHVTKGMRESAQVKMHQKFSALLNLDKK
ncbi:tyrosine-type recombinase/integrase [Viridibacillus arvi]|uniref:tyrosine-type recombinase/integrase n=1 Tax=Viridibacillus arvi TaxID=263475 RepID=UPI003D2B3D61